VPMFLHVNQLQPLHGYTLRLEFNDGTTKDADLSGELHGVVFEPLKDSSFFRRVAVNPETGTIEWPNGADFAPEFLHQIGRAVHHVA
jgi:hypothetical protein